MYDDEKVSTVAGWSVTYPARCNGHLGDLGFITHLKYGSSSFVHFDQFGKPYGTAMPKKVAARLVAMRNRHIAALEWFPPVPRVDKM